MLCFAYFPFDHSNYITQFPGPYAQYLKAKTQPFIYKYSIDNSTNFPVIMLGKHPARQIPQIPQIP